MQGDTLVEEKWSLLFGNFRWVNYRGRIQARCEDRDLWHRESAKEETGNVGDTRDKGVCHD